jgi:hypothetical protein
MNIAPVMLISSPLLGQAHGNKSLFSHLFHSSRIEDLRAIALFQPENDMDPEARHAGQIKTLLL